MLELCPIHPGPEWSMAEQGFILKTLGKKPVKAQFGLFSAVKSAARPHPRDRPTEEHPAQAPEEPPRR